jgi:hypothetical protein
VAKLVPDQPLDIKTESDSALKQSSTSTVVNSAAVENSGPSTQTDDEDEDVIHVVGDIDRVHHLLYSFFAFLFSSLCLQLIPIDLYDTQIQPYATISGCAISCDQSKSTFRINAKQYTTFYKIKKQPSILPVDTTFRPSKYKGKKPMPKDNTFVSIEGYMTGIDFDNSGHPSSFKIEILNIAFLGKNITAPSGEDPGMFFLQSLLTN